MLLRNRLFGEKLAISQEFGTLVMKMCSYIEKFAFFGEMFWRFYLFKITQRTQIWSLGTLGIDYEQEIVALRFLIFCGFLAKLVILVEISSVPDVRITIFLTRNF